MNEQTTHHVRHFPPKVGLINYISVFILAALITSGIYIIKNVNKEYEIRTMAGKLQEFKYAALSFNNVYSGLPGDITNATFYWKDGTKDGNGNRQIEQETGEGIAAFQQMELAQLIKLQKHMSGKWDETKGEGVLVPDVNVPGVRDADTGFFFYYSKELEGNVFGIGQATNKPGILTNPALTPNDAYTLDLMIDDGYPDKGNVIAVSDGSDDCFAVGEYKKESERKECLPLFKL